MSLMPSVLCGVILSVWLYVTLAKLITVVASGYLCYVGFSALNLPVDHSLPHRPRVVVSVEAEVQPGVVAESDHAHASQCRANRKRVDELKQEGPHRHLPVVITTAILTDDTRRVIENDANLRLLGTHCTETDISLYEHVNETSLTLSHDRTFNDAAPHHTFCMYRIYF